MSFDERALIEQVMQQRWYGAKSRGVAHAQVLDSVVMRAEEPPLALALVEMRYETGAHDLYQLLYTVCGDDVQINDDVSLGRELVRTLRAGETLHGGEGMVEFHRAADFAGLRREPVDVRWVGAEQSNTSVVLDEEAILKVFRRLEPGVNPELEMLRFLTDHHFANSPPLDGWYEYSGDRLVATLGILQTFVRGGLDGWELALDEIGAAPEQFLARLHRLGEVTGEMHSVLASDSNDPAFSSETPSVETLGLLTATVDEEIERVFLELPDVEALVPISGRGQDVREQLRMLTHGGPSGKVIRTHGDYHLGQTMWADGDWVILDFEGEPLRTFSERRRKRSPLRDVAGMLRSFAYAASAASLLRGAEAPDGWEEQARERFLDGYLGAVDGALLPPGSAAVERLLAVFELEKAVYELRYELDNRPDWVGIPVAGILRLIEQPPAAS